MSRISRQIDEVHLLKEDRGAVLEVVIARMKLRKRVRIIAVSATVPNIHDVGQWIGEGLSDYGLFRSNHI
jgi:ATP-dependent DNA helicase HFM1/MER3